MKMGQKQLTWSLFMAVKRIWPQCLVPTLKSFAVATKTLVTISVTKIFRMKNYLLLEFVSVILTSRHILSPTFFRCNNDVPSPPVPGTTTAASGPSKTCYNCGYQCNDMVNCIITFSFTIVIFRRVPPAHQSPLILKEMCHSAATLPACPATLRSAATGTSAVVLWGSSGSCK